MYIQKILEHCGVAVLEPDAESIYIRPHEAPRAEKELESEEESRKFTLDAAELAERILWKSYGEIRTKQNRCSEPSEENLEPSSRRKNIRG